MSDTIISEALVAKVRKLLALANHKDTPEHEAASAASKVQEMLQAYSISIHQIESTTSETGLGGKRDKRVHDRSALYQFQRDLMKTLAKNQMCRHWIEEVQVPHERKAGHTRKARRHMLLGREVNVMITTALYDYLTDTMDRLLPYQGMDKRGKDALLWLAGCTDRLCGRLDEQREQAEEESAAKAREEAVRTKHPGAASTGNALVLVDVYTNEDELNTDYLCGLEPGTTTRRRLESEARHKAMQAKRQELIAGGMNADDAYYIASYGEIPSWVIEYRAAEAIREIKAAKPETEAQARARREKEERQSRAYDERYWRQTSKRAEKTSSYAYQQGNRAGADISLDRQVGHTEKAKLS